MSHAPDRVQGGIELYVMGDQFEDNVPTSYSVYLGRKDAGPAEANYLLVIGDQELRLIFRRERLTSTAHPFQEGWYNVSLKDGRRGRAHVKRIYQSASRVRVEVSGYFPVQERML